MIKLNKNKIISIALIVISILSISTTVMATLNPNDYNPRGKGGSSEQALNSIGQVLGYIRVIGIMVAIGSLMIMGIKFIFSSVEEKAEFKKRLVPYLIGFVMFVAIITILSIIQEVATFE